MEYIIRIPQQLGIVLQGRRKSRRMTQQEAAARVGLLPKTISLLEHAPERSSVESLFRLLSSLDFELVLRPKSPYNTGSDSKTCEW